MQIPDHRRGRPPDRLAQILARRTDRRHCLDRIEAEDGKLNSLHPATPERALADARAAEARMMEGECRGPLHGIPIAHKDIYGTAGIATTAHSKLLQDWVPEEDATTVRKLADAGTVMLGKLATHEFAFGGPSFDLPWPPARNPWDPDHFTAGSSSGTGAAVAAGLILGGTGSDTGGSIRGPAALCGIAGIKPTYGLCSRYGVLPLVVLAGPRRPDGLDGRGLRAAAAGDGRPRPARPGQRRPPRPRFLRRAGAGREGPAHRRRPQLARAGPPGQPRRPGRHRPRGRGLARARGRKCAT